LGIRCSRTCGKNALPSEPISPLKGCAASHLGRLDRVVHLHIDADAKSNLGGAVSILPLTLSTTTGAEAIVRPRAAERRSEA
jgi:hypothetical protein